MRENRLTLVDTYEDALTLFFDANGMTASASTCSPINLTDNDILEIIHFFQTFLADSGSMWTIQFRGEEEQVKECLVRARTADRARTIFRSVYPDVAIISAELAETLTSA